MIRKLLLEVQSLLFNSSQKKIFIPNVRLLCLGIFFVVSFANAATFYSRQTGNWTTRSTWSYTSGGGQVPSGIYPIAGDIVHIEGGYTVTLTANAACSSIDFTTTSNNSLLLAGYTLNVSGNITIPRASSTLNTLNVGSGTLTAASIDFPTTGSAVRHKIIISTGTVTVSGSISTDSPTATSATIEFTGTGTLRVGGDFFSSGGGALTPSTGTVELNGTNQTFNAFSYYNLTLSGSGTKTFFTAAATSVTNSLIINSGVNADLGTFTHTANRLTLGSTQVLPSSWGSTTSNAINKSDVYFTATTGKINVSTSTCSNFTTVTPITNVSFNILNKTTSASSTTAYEDYTGDTPTTVAKTQYYALTVKGNTGGDVNGYYSAFFDWNNDGDFDDAGEYFQVGTIRNSSGTDSKVTSVYILIPSTAVTGTIKMRVIGRVGGYNTTPCAISGSTGQMEDYTITVQDACTGSAAPGNTLSTSNPVCASTPLTLSLQNQSTISRAATYAWETSTDGGSTWLSATPAPKNFFFSDFTTAPASTNLYGSATITGGELVLTTAVLSQQGGFVIQTTPGSNINPFTVNFNYAISGGNGADGFSLSYASNINNDAGGGESGEGSGIVVQFDTYDNEGVAVGSRVRVLYNSIQLFDTAIDAPFNLLTATKRNVNLNVDANGALSLSIAGTVFISNLQLPAAYLSSDKSAWKFKFSGRTGGSYDRHIVDDLSIKFLDVLNTASTYTATQTVPTQYRAKVTCGGTTLTSTAITVNMISAVVNPITSSTCSKIAFTVTPTTGTNGTIPSGTTYSWLAPTVTGGITGGAASTGTPASITGTLTNPTATAQTATYTVTPTTSGCVGVPFTVTVTVNPVPTPTFTAQPVTSTCIGISVTYTTQASMSNYVWGFPGVAGTDYTIVSGGTSADNTVTLKYLTTGSKVVTINYTNASTCTAVTATSSSAVTVNALPTPTFNVQAPASTCIGTSVTYTTQGSMSGGYTWGFPGVAGTDYTIVSGGTAGTNTVTLKYLTAGSKIVTINYTNSNGCTAATPTSSSTSTVNALPTPTFTVEPGASACIGTSVTYTTQASMSGYVWGFPGTAGTDYTIVSGGTAGTNTVTLRYLTTGSKTVTINYTNGNTCTAATATSSTATTVNALPTPTFTAQPGATTCIGISVTYTTQASMSNYTWVLPGVAGTNYTIVSGGTNTDNTVTLRYLTTGSKTVTVNYANANSCTAATATSSTATTVNALPTPTFTAQAGSATCIGTSVTYTTQVSMSNYIWGFPGVAGTDYAIISGGTNTDNTATLRYLTAGSKTVTINYTNGNSCTATAATSSTATTVNTLPTPTFTVQPGASTCIGTSVTYTTQVSMSNYIWGFPGVAGTDYTIVSGGTTGTSTVTLRYLTAGSKTVTINYTNGNSCTAATATSSTATTVNALPTPTFTAQPASSTCIGTPVTYTTEASMSSYVWGFPGVAGTDYTIFSGGTSNDNTVTLTYLTAGNKTVTINYTNANSCTAVAATSSTPTTVNTLPVISTQPQALVICEGLNGSFTVATSASSATYQWEYSASVSGPWTVTNAAVGVSGHTTATLSITNIPVSYSGNYVRCTVTSNGCSTISNTALLTVNPAPTAPTVGTPTNVTCTTSGSVTLTNLPAGSWTLNQTGFASRTTTGSGTSYNVTGLAAGTYRFSVSNGTCTSVVSTDAIVLDQSSTTWNGTTWSNGTPDATKAAVIAGAFTVSADLTACSLTINSGISITVPSSRTLNVVNGLTIAPTASLTFDNHSALVQTNNTAGINSGKITYKRIAAQIRQADYVYWSTPVSPQRLIDVSPASSYDKFYGFNGDNWVSTNVNTNMVVGKGYIIRGPNTYSNTAKTDYTASFIGVPNNGTITGEAMTAGKYYLVGNPYPSALNAKKFLDDNLFLDGTLYFWTHNTPVVLSGAYRYSSTDYASYNLTGGVATSESALSGSIPGNNNAKPTGDVGAGQSFFISATTAGTVKFNNGMRLGAANNSQFFKSAATGERHRVWLNMTNAEGAFKQMLVGYVDGATNEYEKRYDGVSFDANPYVDFYSVANGNNYVIQARALPFTDTDQVPLGYRTTIAGNFKISIDEVDGDLTTQNIYLEDKKTGTINDLKAADYTFTTDKGTFADRFVLRYTNKTLGTGDFENAQNGLLVSVKEKTIKVTSSAENIREVTIYDITGKLLYNKKKVGTTELQIQNLPSANQVLLVKVTLDNDFTATKKIIFN